MRESGFDTTFRFGAFSGSTEDSAPVCLNALLYKYEVDMAHFAGLLHKPADVKLWRTRASSRRAAINKYLWDPVGGMYFDYDYTRGKRSSYHYISTFYPLWAGAASGAQAKAVEGHLGLFERVGGLATSDTASGVQWDMPYGWAPITWLAVSGLDQTGFHEDAVRIAQEFTTTVRDNYEKDGTIREKYNVVSSSANVDVSTGYKANVVGFGWTNGVYRKLEDILKQP